MSRLIGKSHAVCQPMHEGTTPTDKSTMYISTYLHSIREAMNCVVDLVPSVFQRQLNDEEGGGAREDAYLYLK